MAVQHIDIGKLAAVAAPFHAVEKHPKFTALRARLLARRDRTIDPGDIAEMEAWIVTRARITLRRWNASRARWRRSSVTQLRETDDARDGLKASNREISTLPARVQAVPPLPAAACSSALAAWAYCGSALRPA